MRVTIGAFTFDREERRLLRGAIEVHVTPKAFDLFAILMRHAPTVVTKSDIHRELWPGTFVSDATLVGLVKELRRVLVDPAKSTSLIRTVHGVGYAIDLPRAAAPAIVPSTITHWLVFGTRRIVLAERDNLIGRDGSAIVWIDLPSVSRRHACLRVDGATAVIEDLGSKNGTTVNGTHAMGPVVLQDRDLIQIGSAGLSYRMSREGLSTETRAGANPR